MMGLEGLYTAEGEGEGRGAGGWEGQRWNVTSSSAANHEPVPPPFIFSLFRSISPLRLSLPSYPLSLGLECRYE